MFTTSDRENLTGNYNIRNIAPFSTFGQKVKDTMFSIILLVVGLAIAYAVIQVLPF